jgi:hypothetical protein
MFEGKRSTADSAWRAYDAFRPFVDRANHDDEVRHNVVRAWSAARKVYDELSDQDAIGSFDKLSRKDRVRDDLDTTVQSLSEAIVRMSGERRHHDRRGGWGLFALAAIAAFVLFNPATGSSTRKWVKDHLLGSEEEFDYATPTY